MKKFLISGLTFFSFTGLALADAAGGHVRDLSSLVKFIMEYINIGIYLIIAFATIAFVYNITKYYVVNAEADRAEAGKYLLYSVIGLAVILSFWGLVNVVIRTFDLDTKTRPDVENLYFK